MARITSDSQVKQKGKYRAQRVSLDFSSLFGNEILAPTRLKASVIRMQLVSTHVSSGDEQRCHGRRLAGAKSAMSPGGVVRFYRTEFWKPLAMFCPPLVIKF